MRIRRSRLDPVVPTNLRACLRNDELGSGSSTRIRRGVPVVNTIRLVCGSASLETSTRGPFCSAGTENLVPEGSIMRSSIMTQRSRSRSRRARGAGQVLAVQDNAGGEEPAIASGGATRRCGGRDCMSRWAGSSRTACTRRRASARPPPGRCRRSARWVGHPGFRVGGGPDTSR